MTKAALRNLYREKRGNLSEETIEDYSIAIANQLLDLSIWENTYFHLFLTIEKQKEIQTDFILHILQGKDKNCIISKSDFSNFTMKSYLLQDHTKIVLNAYGIPEPVEGIEIDHSKIEVVFVPLLAYDKKGNRVGYGKGFYDRFLKECKPDCIKIGLSFFPPENEAITVLKTDISLDFCVTPEKTYAY